MMVVIKSNSKNSQLREKKNYIFRSTEVEGMSTSVSWENGCKARGWGPHLGYGTEPEVPAGKGGRQTTHAQVHIAPFFS